MSDVRLSGLRIAETVGAFESLLALASDIQVPGDVVEELSSQSQGYPYLVQLVGYHFVEHMRSAYPTGVRTAGLDDVLDIEEEVYATYRTNVLVPSTKGLGREARAYLRAMASLLDDEGFAGTGRIAAALGKDPKGLSSCRRGLLERRLILSGGYGKVCYGLPYLTRYSTEDRGAVVESFEGCYVPR